MKQRYKKENAPRMQSAINRTFLAHLNSWYMFVYDVRALGMWCLSLAYGADKYDILNKLVKGFSKPLVSFIRGDIRYIVPKAVTTQINMVLVIFILILTF